MNKNQDKGFTLVELLIVIVILGILATVTVFAVRGITDTGRQNACDTEYKTVQTAAEAYYAQNPGTVAPSVQALFDGNYLGDEGAVSNWTVVDNTANPGATATFTPISTGECADWTA